MEGKKYEVSICLIIKDENEYLQEWIRHHLSIGVDHFYIYDNNSKIPIQTTVNQKLRYDEREHITVIDWSGHHHHAQEEAYNDCLTKFRQDTKWCGFIDTDEFIVINNGKTIKEFLKDYENYAGLYINWQLFNANGHVKKERKPVMERFTHKIDDLFNLGKLFVQMDCTIFMKIHEAQYSKNQVGDINMFTVNENYEYVIAKNSITSTKLIQCNHYITRSWEEWRFKIIERGVPDPIFGRKLTEFFMYNPDLDYLNDGTERKQEYEPVRNK